jgi:hypothetical protein
MVRDVVEWRWLDNMETKLIVNDNDSHYYMSQRDGVKGISLRSA